MTVKSQKAEEDLASDLMEMSDSDFDSFEVQAQVIRWANHRNSSRWDEDSTEKYCSRDLDRLMKQVPDLDRDTVEELLETRLVE